MATQSRIGWRPYVNPFTPEDPGTPNTIDQDVTNFILASGISDSVQTSAIETLVSDLKAYGLWTKMKAIYPFVGGSAASHKFNLKDPRDLDAAYRLTFMGGGTHDVNGYKGNGTTAYAITYINPSVNLGQNNIHSSWYSKLNITGAVQAEIGQVNGTFKVLGYSINGAVTGWVTRLNNSTNSTIVSTTNTIGFYQMSRTNSLDYIMQKNATQTTITKTSEKPTSSNIILLGASSTTELSGRQLELVTIGDGLTSAECSNLYISVQKFQTTLGRQVGTPYVSDPDAIAFLTAAGITDGTQAAAINTLVIRMKADGTWSKMKAIYPFVGGNATSHKFNLKDPRDLDAAYRLVFNGGWTHTSTGALPNGTTGWADTKLAPSSVLTINSTHFSFYSRTNNAQNGADMGTGLIAPVMAMRIKYSDNNGYFDAYSYPTGRITVNMGSINSTSLFIHSRTSTSVAKVYRSGIQIGGGSVPQGSDFLPSGNVFISSTNDSGAKHFSNRETAFASIGDGLTDAEATALYNAVQAYQTTLGRQTDIPLVSDTDAQAFLNAANITSFQQASAVNKLVVDLKAAGVWTKMKAIYPFVGGSAASHKFNLKDPRDLDAAYRLVFNGGWTHSSTGVLPNGTTAYANTFLSPNSRLNLTSNHFSYYSRSNIAAAQQIEMGVADNLAETPLIAFSIRFTGDIYRYFNPDYNVTNISTSNTDSRGFYVGSRTANNSHKTFKDGNQQGVNTTTITQSTLPSSNLYIGVYNFAPGAPAAYSSKESAFASIGDGLTDAEATAFYTAVQTYQTSLGRHVATPVYNNGLVLSLDAGSANSYPGTGTTWFDLVAGNNGTLVNGPTYDATNGGSILFDGVNDRISTFPTQFPNNGSKTIDVWFKTTSTIRQGLCGTRDTLSTGWVFTINRTTSGRLTYFHTGSGVAEFSAGITTNTWYNAVATHDSTTGLVKIYLNGSLIGSSNVGVIYSSSFNGVIGDEDSTVPSTPFKGNIPKVNIYNKVLTDTEILSNFNSTRGRFGL